MQWGIQSTVHNSSGIYLDDVAEYFQANDGSLLLSSDGLAYVPFADFTTGTTMSVTAKVNSAGNVSTIDDLVKSANGVTLFSATLSIGACNQGYVCYAQAPTVGVDAILVGYGNGYVTTFTEANGTISYASSTPLGHNPSSDIGLSWVQQDYDGGPNTVNENSNLVYGVPSEETTTTFTTTVGESVSSTTTTGSSTSSANSPSTVLSCSPSPVVVGSPAKCTARVTGSSPIGKVTWSSSGSGRFSTRVCKLSQSACSVKYTPTSSNSPVEVTASYAGDKHNPPSVGTFSLTVVLRTTKTSVSCKPNSVVAGSSTVTKCTAKVTGYSPTGTVTWSSIGNGVVSLPTAAICTLKKGSCSVTFTGISFNTAAIQATYGGDPDNTASSGTTKLTIKQAKTSLSVSCVPSSMAVGSNATCTATLTGHAGSVAGESVSWSQSVGPGKVSFTSSSSTTCALPAGGICSVTLTGTSEGSATIEAVYSGDQNNLGSSTVYKLMIEP
jgi:hypothetical protein